MRPSRPRHTVTFTAGAATLELWVMEGFLR
jgi:hypothetical protein